MKDPPRQQANLQRCLTFLRDIQRRSATEILNSPFGVAFFNRNFPDKHDLNVFWIERIAPSSDVGVLIQEVERIQGERELAYRRLIVEERDALEKLSPTLQALAWVYSSNVLMIRDVGAPTSAPGEITVQIVSREQLGDPIYRWYLDEEGLTKHEAMMLMDASRVTEDSVPTLHLAAALGTKVAGWCELRILGQTAQLENVGTRRKYRRRGVGTALVNYAVDVSGREGAEVIFLQTDAADRVQHLYSRLGFLQVGALHRFMKSVV
jgi:ribosomal protein S18 acetylase RimI-like enzyme